MRHLGALGLACWYPALVSGSTRSTLRSTQTMASHAPRATVAHRVWGARLSAGCKQRPSATYFCYGEAALCFMF